MTDLIPFGEDAIIDGDDAYTLEHDARLEAGAPNATDLANAALLRTEQAAGILREGAEAGLARKCSLSIHLARSLAGEAARLEAGEDAERALAAAAAAEQVDRALRALDPARFDGLYAPEALARKDAGGRATAGVRKADWN